MSAQRLEFARRGSGGDDRGRGANDAGLGEDVDVPPPAANLRDRRPLEQIRPTLERGGRKAQTHSIRVEAESVALLDGGSSLEGCDLLESLARQQCHLEAC